MEPVAEQIMTPNPICIDHLMRCEEVREILISKKITGAPVTETTGKLIGVISIMDLLVYEQNAAFTAEASGYVSDYMSFAQEVGYPDTPVIQLVKLMSQHRMHRIVIIHPETLEPLGIVSSLDIIDVIAKRPKTPKP